MQLLASVNWGTSAFVLLGIVATVGLLAVLSPRRFSVLATRGGQWVDSNKALAVLDKRVDIDAYVLPFSRLLGVAVLGAVAVVSYLIYQH